MVPESIEREVVIEASIETVWSILTEPRHLARWLCDSAEVDVRPGGELALQFDRLPTPALGTVEQVERPHRFAFRWVTPEPDRDPSALDPAAREKYATRVEFLLLAEGESTVLRVVESGFSTVAGTEAQKAELAERHEGGWGGFLVGDPTRRQLLDVLLSLGEATPTRLAQELPVTRQAVTKHLAVLDRAGLVDVRREGREVRYVVHSEQLDEVSRAIARVAASWDKRLAAVKRLAESVQAAESVARTKEGAE